MCPAPAASSIFILGQSVQPETEATESTAQQHQPSPSPTPVAAQFGNEVLVAVVILVLRFCAAPASNSVWGFIMFSFALARITGKSLGHADLAPDPLIAERQEATLECQQLPGSGPATAAPATAPLATAEAAPAAATAILLLPDCN